jgi:predicted transcriptional regulator
MERASSNQPCAEAIWYVLPKIRAGLAKELGRLGLNQQEIADELGLSQAAVSQYVTGKRGKGKTEKLSRDTYDLLIDLSSRLIDDEVDDLRGRICTICEQVREDQKNLSECKAEGYEKVESS